jgi:hypothetical protein
VSGHYTAMYCSGHLKFEGHCEACRAAAGVGAIARLTKRHIAVGRCKCGGTVTAADWLTHVPGAKPVRVTICTSC